MCFTIFQKENTPFQSIKTRSSKSRKIDIFQGGYPWFWSKNGHFSNFYFLGNTGQENVFYDILERKNVFLGYKNKTFKKLKNWHFPKGLTHGFNPKMASFPTLIFKKIQARKMSLTIFQNENTPFQAIKTRSSKTRKIDIFPKGLSHDFGAKIAVFPTYFFRQCRAEQCLLRYSRTKFAVLGYKNKKFKKSKNFSFFQRG